VLVACLRRRKRREKRKGRAASVMPFISAVGDRGRREGSGVKFAWKRETCREGGGAGATVGGRHRPVANGHGWAARMARRRAGEAGSLTRGPKATVTGGAV
jgi:hypothetical protein